MEGIRHRQGNHLHPGTVHASQILKAFIILRQSAVMGRGRIRFHDGDYGIPAHKTHHVVNMAVRIIPFNAGTEPENGSDAQHALQFLLNHGPAPIRIAVGIQQHGLRRHQQAVPIALNRPPFQNQGRTAHGKPQRRPNQGGNAVVQVPRGKFAAPRIKLPIRQHQRTVLHILDENGAVVPAPYVVGRVVEQAELLLTHSGGQHRLPDAGMKGSCGIHAYKGMRSNGSGGARTARQHPEAPIQRASVHRVPCSWRYRAVQLGWS